MQFIENWSRTIGSLLGLKPLDCCFRSSHTRYIWLNPHLCILSAFSWLCKTLRLPQSTHLGFLHLHLFCSNYINPFAQICSLRTCNTVSRFHCYCPPNARWNASTNQFMYFVPLEYFDFFIKRGFILANIANSFLW